MVRIKASFCFPSLHKITPLRRLTPEGFDQIKDCLTPVCRLEKQWVPFPCDEQRGDIIKLHAELGVVQDYGEAYFLANRVNLVFTCEDVPNSNYVNIHVYRDNSKHK
ncbi:MAG: hypothetical protein WC533_02895 [Candidatus Pacearchaeota archaeon]